MTGVLNYAAPARSSRAERTFATLSTCTASLIFLLPPAVTLVSLALQRMLSRPGRAGGDLNISLLVLLIPSIAMLLIPVVGLLFGAASVLVSPGRSGSGFVGLALSSGGLIAGVMTILR